jgi:hypothetical protein
MAIVYVTYNNETKRVIGISSFEEDEREGFTTKPFPSFAVAIGWVWDEEKQTFQPSLEPTSPTAMTMRQARLVLLQRGILPYVDYAINAITNEIEREAARISWEYSTEVQRTHPLIADIGTQLGLSDSDIDELFIEGSML